MTGRPMIDKATLDVMRSVLEPMDTPERRAAYLRGDYPRKEFTKDLDKRYRWDLMYDAKMWHELPEGCLDEHIYTALRRIIPSLTD